MDRLQNIIRKYGTNIKRKSRKCAEKIRKHACLLCLAPSVLLAAVISFGVYRQADAAEQARNPGAFGSGSGEISCACQQRQCR